MAYKAIIYEKKGKIGYVTLNRPETLNATDHTMHNELWDCWQNIMKDDDVWVVVLTGTGRGFCVGADMKDAARRAGTGESQVSTHYGAPDPVEMNKPLICAINGICAGGGFNFVGASDIIICSDKAEFLEPHLSVGWLPLGETMVEVTRMPFGLGMRMALMGTSERMSAERAYQVGLVSEIVPHDKLMERATEIAEKVLLQAPLAARVLKENIYRIVRQSPYAAALEQARKKGDTGRIKEHSEDAKEGPRAFAQKRKPVWTGRWID